MINTSTRLFRNMKMVKLLLIRLFWGKWREFLGLSLGVKLENDVLRVFLCDIEMLWGYGVGVLFHVCSDDECN
ncbi:unnamed protein product [Trifolium pratense]|uniref:Uncharacterized protein n=1 Tax=Trifolium pratense TaxID=57577 RepID=A0ACB0IZ80_TRIPR|nr:unnamed protein product [Trifolium pratense]